MKIHTCILCVLFVCSHLFSQEVVNRGADEKSLSRSEYFSWINNTNEGPSEKQTLINMDFFEWLRNEYGMELDIYAFDAGLIDGKNFYGDMESIRFKQKFPDGLDTVYRKAQKNGMRLGMWGGPDGFGNTLKSAQRRKDMLVSLCRDYHWALFKFDAVCGPLREDKESMFIEMMKQCREYSPDLILLNHRLGLKKAEEYATTFLWEGRESYIDVNSSNTVAATHNRVGAMSRGHAPDLRRLTEDHGVCLSSCLDYWEDELVLQVFNRALILSPQIYGNPWLLSDEEYPKLARIFNLHKRFAECLVSGMKLPESYGEYAVSRGNDSVRVVTLRNLSWLPRTITVRLDEEIGLKKGKRVVCRMYHPVERISGIYSYGQSVEVMVLPFRSLLLSVSSDECIEEIGVEGVDFEIIKDVPGKPVEMRLLGFPGTEANIRLTGVSDIEKVEISGKDVTKSVTRKNGVKISFPGEKYTEFYHRKLVELFPSSIPRDAAALYEATVFAADNNALEVRSLYRSGNTKIAQVKAAREAFFTQPAFINRGVWDKNLFDGRMNTLFGVSKIKGGRRIKGGCFRLDLGHSLFVDSIRIKVNNEYMLQPLMMAEGNFARISSDLKTWESILFLADTTMNLKIGKEMRYLKLNPFPEAIAEVEVYAGGKKLNSENFRASNLFADAVKCAGAWNGNFSLRQVPKGSYLCVAINGRHGIEGAYATLKVDGRYIGAASRAVSYPANPWENATVLSDSNYTYFFPLDKSMEGKQIEVFVLGYESDKLNLKPEVWITAYPIPYEEKLMKVYRR
ncbi:putative uncharacterized protein [Tannerella sp. CAG:51]|nr:putative uncharacterized protein [Tannerella sp. CAG:51]